MKKERLQELAGVQLNESNDKVMYQEELKDIAKTITTAWDRAKSLDIDYEEFLHTIKKVSDDTLQNLTD